jgi:hypothetical protein
MNPRLHERRRGKHTQLLRANPLSPPSGSYELTARLELPHLERWGVDKTTRVPYFARRTGLGVFQVVSTLIQRVHRTAYLNEQQRGVGGVGRCLWLVVLFALPQRERNGTAQGDARGHVALRCT